MKDIVCYVKISARSSLILRGDYMQRILNYVHEEYPRLDVPYQAIYAKNDETCWFETEREFNKDCDDRNIRYINACYHSKPVKEKVGKS